MSERLVELAQEAVALARKHGADDAEAYVGTLEGLHVASHGRLTYVREMNESGVSVRLQFGARAGIASADGLSHASLERAARDAMARALASPASSTPQRFVDPVALDAPTRVHPALAAQDADAQLRAASRVAEAIAGARDVSYHESTLASYDQSFAVANSRGHAAWDRDVIQVVQAEARVTSGGASRTAADLVCLDEPVEDALALDAWAGGLAERAAFATRARPLPRAVDEAIFTPLPAGQILKLWLPSLAGEPDGPHAPPRAKPIGERVASDALTVLDAPRSRGGPRRQRVDDEGTPTRDAPLVERGVLRQRMMNATIAGRRGIAPTGHAFRPLVERWSAGAQVTVGNLHVKPGAKSLEDLVSGMDRGVVLTDRLLGAFVTNPRTGDFSLVAPTCLYVERGSVQHALPSTTIGGDVHALVQRVLAVGREPGRSMDGCVPAFHAQGVAIAT